jgi:hypothetical protein
MSAAENSSIAPTVRQRAANIRSSPPIPAGSPGGSTGSQDTLVGQLSVVDLARCSMDNATPGLREAVVRLGRQGAIYRQAALPFFTFDQEEKKCVALPRHY